MATSQGKWLAWPVLVGACSPRQSFLHPAGPEAAEVTRLFWIMVVGGAAIWLVVLGTVVFAVLARRRATSERLADRFTFWGGIVFPAVTLAALLVMGLALLPSWRQHQPDLRIHISTENFWWRVTYETPDGGRVETANEVHLPVDAVVEFVITTPDVSRSFWIPALGGKVDAVPGRINVLQVTAANPGTYRGLCAENCGQFGAQMGFEVQVHPKPAFDDWLAAEAKPAVTDAAPFRGAGCAECHSIRGAMERGRTGPDLTHLARRQTIAAGTLPLTADTLRNWLVASDAGNAPAHEPGYRSLPAADIDALVAALMDLR